MISRGNSKAGRVSASRSVFRRGVDRVDDDTRRRTISHAMRVITYSHARRHLAETMEKVCNDRSGVIITGRNAGSVVMMSLEEYDSLEETAHLLRSPGNARRLLDAVEGVESGKGRERELLEP